jgi:4-hydroxybenzoate polyprenyltransferase/phosphoserine phosphatase
MMRRDQSARELMTVVPGRRLTREWPSADEAVPLCVDLDGTLVRGDTLLEGIAAALCTRHVLSIAAALLAGDRAALKRRVAAAAPVDPTLLPYDANLLEYLREQRAAGRMLVLATGADSAVAHAVAVHLGLFDEVVCSDGKRNLKGKAKAAALVARFGHKGFAYAGNDASDIPVWEAAQSVVVVNASRALRDKAAALAPVEAEFAVGAPSWRAALRAMRPHQWVKNLLVLVPMVTAHTLTHSAEWGAALGIFAAFCATASAVYIVNDLVDLAADRRHPSKRRRPFASGALSLPVGVALAAALFAAGLSLAAVVDAVHLVLIYAAASLAYSLALKEFPLVDVFMLAGLYTLRVLAGGVATGHPVSLWLLAFSGFFFLSLSLIKRTEELMTVAASNGERVAARRGYFAGDLPIVQMFGCASAFASAAILALFVGSNAAFANYGSPEFLWGIVPLILFWQCRLWLATIRGHMHEDPIVYAAHDWVSWLVAGAVLLMVTVASSGIMSFM